ncbi:MAG: hypothetical protein K8S00_10475, partial [Bacteroidales bacterium]|nr:hypothetical protein [Bacteroidales bacterium]
MKIKFLQADHGDSILVSFDENNIRRNILIDGGPGTAYKEKDRRTGRYIAKTLQKELARLKNNNEKIDLLILTHVDDD